MKGLYLLHREKNTQNSVVCFGECMKKFQQLTRSVSLQNSLVHDAEVKWVLLILVKEGHYLLLGLLLLDYLSVSAQVKQ